MIANKMMSSNVQKDKYLRCIDVYCDLLNGIVLKLLIFVYIVRELMEEGEGVQRLVQVTNLAKDRFLFPLTNHFR